MSLSVGNVFGSFELLDKFSKTFKDFDSQMQGVAKQVATAGAVLSAFSAGLGVMAKKAISAAGEWEQTNIAFTTLLGSAAEAKKFLAEMQDFAAKTPFELPGLLEGSRRMMAMGFTAKEVKPMLTAVGDAVAGLGLGQEGIQRVTLALGQMRAKGKVSAEEMRQLAEAGIPAWQFLATAIGTDIPTAMKKAEKGTIEAGTAINAIIEGMNSKFGGMMAAQSKTFMGQISTLKDELGFVMRDFGSALMPLAQAGLAFVQGMLPVVRGLAQAFKELNPHVKTALSLFVGLAAAAGPALLAFAGGVKTIGGLGTALSMATAQMNAFAMSSMMVNAKFQLAMTGMQTGVAASGALAVAVAAAGLAIGVTLGGALEKSAVDYSRFDMATHQAAAEVGLFSGAVSLAGPVLTELGENISFLAREGLDQLKTGIPFLDAAFHALTIPIQTVISLGKELGGILSELGTAVAGKLVQGFEAWGAAMFKIEQSGGAAQLQVRTMVEASKLAGRNVTDYAEALRIVMEHGKKLIPAQDGANKAITTGATITKEAAEKAARLAKETQDIERASKVAGKAVKNHADALVVLRAMGIEPATEKTDKLTKELEKQAEALAKVRAAFTGANEQAEMKELASAFKGFDEADFLALAPKKLEELVKKVQELHEAGAKLPEVFAPLAGFFEAAGPPLDQIVTKIDKLKAGTIHLLPSTRDAMGLGGGGLAKLGLEAGTTFGSKMKDSLKTSLATMPSIIMQAITGGGDVGRAIGAHLGQSIGTTLGEELGKKVGEKAGKTLGSVVGSVVPVVGTLIGSFVGGKLGGLFGKLFGGGEEKKVNDMRDDFLAAFGGFEKLQAKLVGLTDQDLVKKIFDAKTVDQFNAAVNETMELLGLQAHAQDEARAALEKYNIGLDKTSQVFAQGELNQQAMQFFKEFELITKGAGVSVEETIRAMGEQGFTDFVQTARAAGATIPEALRPMVEALIQSGQLLDENGNAFESAEDAGITFAQTVEESMKKLVEQIERMVNALLGIPNRVNVDVGVTGPGGLPDKDIIGTEAHDYKVEGFAHYGVITQPKLIAAGEAGPEAIVPLHEAQGRGGDMAYAEMKLNERTLAYAVVELQRGNRYGFRTDFQGGMFG